MPEMRLEGATKFYKWEKRKLAAVSNLNVTIAQGEFVFVVGSSGAGKTTLLKLLCGALHPEQGAVYLDQLNLKRAPPWFWPRLRRNFGQVHQEMQLMRRRTVRENLHLAARSGFSTGEENMKEKTEKALGIVGMARSGDKYPGELSVGETRRVELARAIINSPPILILDELTSSLDEDNIWDLMHLLTELNRQGTTVVMATHASTFVNILRRRVITLVDGEIAGDIRRGKYGDITGNPLGGKFGAQRPPSSATTDSPPPSFGDKREE